MNTNAQGPAAHTHASGAIPRGSTGEEPRASAAADAMGRATPLSQRLTAQFAPAHLTLASIIQGVALSALVIRVEETHTSFDAVAWLLAAATFLVIVDIWHEDLMMVVAYVWLPTLFDSLVPFGFVAAELFLGYFVYGNVRGWLLAYAACYLVGVVAWLLQNTEVRLLESENQQIKDVLATSDRIRGMLAVVLAVLSLAAWALYDVLHLGQAHLIIAILALIGTSVFLASSIPGWNRLLAYARSQR
ncbi:MAG: hypothetical protein ACXVDI_26560 [Ktedonobacterales bacterium]